MYRADVSQPAKLRLDSDVAIVPLLTHQVVQYLLVKCACYLKQHQVRTANLYWDRGIYIFLPFTDLMNQVW